jgi:long-chain acyl-CoA synthetase
MRLSDSFLFRIFEKNRYDPAIIWRGQTYSYAWLLDCISDWRQKLAEGEIDRGSVVTLEAEYSPGAIALFLALLERGCIIVPLTMAALSQRDVFCTVAKAQVSIVLNGNELVEISSLSGDGQHPYYDTLRRQGHPGLILFTSGSTGDSKAAVHDLTSLLEKFKVQRRKLRSIAFLLFDHIGGVNTLMYSLANGGCIVMVEDPITKMLSKLPSEVLMAVC